MTSREKDEGKKIGRDEEKIQKEEGIDLNDEVERGWKGENRREGGGWMGEGKKR